MIKRFDVTIENQAFFKERKQVYASDVLDMFNGINWQEDLNKCWQAEDEFGTSFSVTYTDEHNLEYFFDVEIFLDEETRNEHSPLRFSLSYAYPETRMKRVLFGLLGEKKEIIKKTIFMDDQDYAFTLKCLNAFLRHDHAFLMNTMYTQFGRMVE